MKFDAADMAILEGVGLNKSQAQAYIHLLDIGELTPVVLADKQSETRTNAYSILDRLEKLGLAKRTTIGKRISYVPTNPVALETMIEKRRNLLLNNEFRFKAILPHLTRRFYQLTEQPAATIYQGEQGLRAIFDDILQTKQDVYLIMTPNQHDFLGSHYLEDFVTARVKHGIKVFALTPHGDGMEHNLRNDKKHLFERAFYDAQSYATPVEINIYGDKVAYLSYGEEVFGTVIHSQQIADSMRQIFTMLKLHAALPVK
ncbi:MAG: helix-turn-helix domain-containing protein [bacterium]